MTLGTLSFFIKTVCLHVCAENCRLDELIFNSRNLGVPCVLRFHPYEPHLAVADKDHIRSDCILCRSAIEWK